MAAGVGILASSFNDDALVAVSIFGNPRPRLEYAARVPEKNSKKAEKKLVRVARLPLEGNVERQMPSFRRSKKVQKSEKKACQGLRNLISLLKPNQTNGETNDTKRTKNV